MTFQPISTDIFSDDAWYEAGSGVVLRLNSREGGPGWSGACLELQFQEQSILIKTSWPTPLGQYLVRVQSVKLPKKMLMERQQIEHLITKSINAFCFSDYYKDFSPRAFLCKIDMEKTAWTENSVSISNSPNPSFKRDA